jgi:hypothetical protein
VRQAETNPALPVLKSMSLEEKLEMLRRLQAGELRVLEAGTSANGAPAVIEPSL